MQTWD